jgi:cysteine-S-conjugate beta-lyase
LSELCAERDILVVADEVYYALLHDGARFTPFASVSPTASMSTVTVTSASKSFNLTGLKHSLVIAENPALLEAYDRGQRKSNAYYGGSVIGIVATEAALRHGDAWVEELMSHIGNNRALLRSWFAMNAPEVAVFDADSTYFAWLDCSAWAMGDDQLMRWFEEEGRIILTAGRALGAGGEGHVRWNLACSRPTLEMGLDRLGEALRRLKTSPARG